MNRLIDWWRGRKHPVTMVMCLLLGLIYIEIALTGGPGALGLLGGLCLLGAAVYGRRRRGE